MLLPRIWDEDLFENMDNWMSWPDESEFFGKKNPLYGKHAKNLMKTDVRETEDAYEVDIDLPGFKKDEVTITVENGYLNISAVKGLDKDETDKKTGKYIRQERYAGSCSRTFYVGEAVEPEDVSAKFENGILQLHILKKEAKKVEKKDNRIAIAHARQNLRFLSAKWRQNAKENNNVDLWNRERREARSDAPLPEHAAGDSPARFKGFAILLGRDRRMWEGPAGECAAESPRILPNLRAAGFFTG